MDIYWVQNNRTTYEKNIFLSITKYARACQYIKGESSYDTSHSTRKLIRAGEQTILVDVLQGILPYDTAGIIREGVGTNLAIYKVADIIPLNPTASPLKELIILESKTANSFTELLTRANGKAYKNSRGFTLPNRFHGRVVVESHIFTDDNITTLCYQAKNNNYHHTLVIKEQPLV